MNLFEFPERRPVYKNKSLIPNTPDAFGSADAFFGRKQESVIPTMGAYAPSKAPLGKTPKVYNPEIPLFSDEQKMLQRMKADNLNDDQAYELLKQRRSDLLGGSTAIGADEKQMLIKMQADKLTAKEATNMIQQRRYDNANKIRDMHPTEGVGEQTAKAVPRAIGDVASQAWQGVGQGLEGLINASFRGVNDINQMIGSSDYSPELSNALPKGGYIGDVAKIGAGTTSSIFNLGKAPIALGINTANQLPGTQYITQGIGKLIQSGAEKGGKMTGLDSETSMDIATTGMNLLGMKPGINTMQYGKNIRSAYRGIETPGLISRGIVPATIEAVKEPGKALIQTARMPYDIAKGTIQGGKNIVRNIQPTIASASDAIQTGLNRMTKGEINKFQAEQGVSPGKYLNDRGIVSSGKPIEETLLEQMKASRDQATAGMDAIQGNYKMPERQFGDTKIDYLRQMLEDNYNKAVKTLDAEGTTKAKQLLDKYDSEGLSMTEINQSKRKMAENNPVNWLTDSASDRVQTVKRISDEVRNWQFKQAEIQGFKNLKQINKQTQAFYKLHEGITKWNDGIEANNKISLTDYLAFDADPSVFLAKKVLSSPRVRQGLVRGLNKVSGRVVKPIEKATIGDINTKRAEYDFGNSNGNIGDRVDTRKQLRISAPTGKSSGAKNFRVNQPKETSGYKNDTQVGKRPTGYVKTENTVLNIAKESASQKTMKSIKETIASEVKQARFGGVGETRVQSTIESNLLKGKITIEEAKQIVEDILDSVTKGERTYPYTTKKGLETYLEKLYSSNYKIDGADLFEIPVKEVTPKKITPTEKVEPKKVEVVKEGKIDINSVLKEFNEKSKYFRDSGVTVKSLNLEGNIDDLVKSGKKLKEGWSFVEQKKLGKTEKIQGWYIQEPLNSIGGGTTITAIRADGVGVRVSLPNGYKSIEGTVARDFVENVIDRNPFIDTEIKGIVEKQISSQTQANGPTVIGKMGKVGKKTAPQSPTAYEQGMRRPYTLQANKPIVKRASDSTKPIGVDKPKSIPVKNQLVEEARKYNSAEEFVKGLENEGKIVYHGTKAKFDTFDKKYIGKNFIESEGGGFFFSQNEKKAKSFAKYLPGGNDGYVMKVALDIKNPIRKKTNSDYYSPADIYDRNRSEINREININNERFNDGMKGYKKIDGIIIEGTNDDTLYVVFEPSQIKTESQLKDIYNQANKPKTITHKSPVKNPLVEEARKYKSAEEFADGVFGAEKGNTYKNVPKDLIDNEYLEYFDNKIYFKQKIDKGTVESWKERIKKGERPPIKIDDTNGRFELGDGHHRYQAYKELGFEKIPAFYKSELISLFNKIK